MRLSHLIDQNAKVNPMDIDYCKIKSIVFDSRKVVPGAMFFAIRGLKENGENFIEEAAKKGASAIVTQTDCKVPVPSPCAHVVVDDVRRALSYASSKLYGEPSKNLKVIGVTGTNGKSTTCHLLESIFNAAGFTTGIITTLGSRLSRNEIKETYEDVSLTTPESVDIHRALNEFLKAGVTHVAMEVSSHALKLSRTEDVHFDGGIFTNLSLDHSDFHPTMENYFEAKQRLFDPLLTRMSVKSQRIAVIGLGDEWGKRLYDHTQSQLPTDGFAYEKTESTFAWVEKYETSLEGIQAKIFLGDLCLEIKSTLLGRYNLMNILASASMAFRLGISLKNIVEGVNALKSVPGRLERVVNPRMAIFVDYAHTPEALEVVLSTLKPHCRNRLWVVFGCGGNRDKQKRPLMARVTERYADHVIVTTDNPRFEDPMAIIDDVRNGFSNPENFTIIPDRYLALKEVLQMASEGDCIVVAGKGHERFQLVKNERIPWDDHKILKDLLAGK